MWVNICSVGWLAVSQVMRFKVVPFNCIVDNKLRSFYMFLDHKIADSTYVAPIASYSLFYFIFFLIF